MYRWQYVSSWIAGNLPFVRWRFAMRLGVSLGRVLCSTDVGCIASHMVWSCNGAVSHSS